MLARI